MHAPEAEAKLTSMTTELTLLDRDTLHATFDTWAAAEESLDAELSESLEALAAYQSHLDAWQRQLAGERTALIQAREQFERDEAAAAASQMHSTAEAGAELTAARQKVADLTSSLLARTEELRTLDNRRAEVVSELELARAREKELKTALDEQKRLLDQERAQSTEDLRHLREMLEHRGESVESIGRGNNAAAKQPLGLPRTAAPTTNRDRTNSGAVLGSIVEQFGKLRQQRAVDRQGLKKSR
jgi:chromosome segregation ATPase